MKVSELLAPTLREIPAEAEVISHQLLLRAGLIRKSAAGVYTLMPLAWRVIRKIEQIVREEMDAKGGQELMMPIMQPAELWLESGRWNVYGEELFRLKDRHGRDFCLSPTHEEMITSLVRGEVYSYKQLPLLLYQIQNKYRDERRPRFGLMRGREFIMKDLYSFDRDEAGLDLSYKKMYDAYTRVFQRCGLQFRPVEADSGAIGGNNTHEFMVLAESGEAVVVFCPDDSCGYAANNERAETPDAAAQSGEALPLQEVSTPDSHTVEEVCQFLQVGSDQIIKTVLYETDKGTVAALVRGNREVNEIKLQKAVDCLYLEIASGETVRQLTGAEVGFAGPVGLTGVQIIADTEIATMVNALCGANRTGFHLTNVNPQRDFKWDKLMDLKLVKKGDPCPHCGQPLEEARGIEVGQVFKLGTKYSEALQATFLDEKGETRNIVMGCYGIGVTRTMAAAIEQNYDENGIIWPMAIAPYQVAVIPVSSKDAEQMALAEKLYQQINQAGLEAVLDDRNERPGVKFKDADLIGYPLRLIIGKKTLEEGTVELKFRRSGEMEVLPLSEAVARIQAVVEAEK